MGKEPACKAGDPGDAGLTLGREGPLEKEMASHSSVLPGESRGRGSLAGYSAKGHREPDTAERLAERSVHTILVKRHTLVKHLSTS